MAYTTLKSKMVTVFINIIIIVVFITRITVAACVYTLLLEVSHQVFCHQMDTFSNLFHSYSTLSNNFATKWPLKITPHLKRFLVKY